MRVEVFNGRTLASAPLEEQYTWRVLYADHVPVSAWSAVFCESFDEAKSWALKRADRDLHPTSNVTDNIIILERWDGDSWDAYNADGEDLTEVAFGWEA